MKKKILICGNFNIVHSGHIRIFEFAKKMNAKLIVGVLCDKIARKKVYNLIDNDLKKYNLKPMDIDLLSLSAHKFYAN